MATRTLYLLRHAKSSWTDASLSDADRPLAGRGRRAARALADHCRREQIAPELVLCSSSRRTRETLDLVAPGLPAGVALAVDDALYAAGADELLARLRSLPGGLSSVMIIAHNPGTQELALMLARGGRLLEAARAKFPTGGLATLGIDGPSWRELGPGGAEMLGFVTPAQLTDPVPE